MNSLTRIESYRKASTASLHNSIVALDYDGVLTNEKLRNLTDDPYAVCVDSTDTNSIMADTIAIHKHGSIESIEERLKKAQKLAPYATKLLLIDEEDERMCTTPYGGTLYPGIVCPGRSVWQRKVYLL